MNKKSFSLDCTGRYPGIGNRKTILFFYSLRIIPANPCFHGSRLWEATEPFQKLSVLPVYLHLIRLGREFPFETGEIPAKPD